MSWSQIQGHDRLVDMFRQAVRNNRLAHAYLFVGPPGVGKRMFASALAKSLLCERNGPGELEACGSCDSCKLVEARTHPDFFVMEPPWVDPVDKKEKNEIPINLMRELCSGF